MYDEIFNDEEEFIKFFGENDSEENREAILKTSKLCYWYCLYITMDEKLFKKITSVPYVALLTIKYWDTKYRDALVSHFNTLVPDSIDLKSWSKSALTRRMTLGTLRMYASRS